MISNLNVKDLKIRVFIFITKERLLKSDMAKWFRLKKIHFIIGNGIGQKLHNIIALP